MALFEPMSDLLTQHAQGAPGLLLVEGVPTAGKTISLQLWARGIEAKRAACERVPCLLYMNLWHADVAKPTPEITELLADCGNRVEPIKRAGMRPADMAELILKEKPCVVLDNLDHAEHLRVPQLVFQIQRLVTAGCRVVVGVRVGSLIQTEWHRLGQREDLTRYVVEPWWVARDRAAAEAARSEGETG